jgi:hypothetical protein
MNRYVNIPLTEINKKVAYKTVRYPEIPLTSDDIYVYIEQGDRFDVLANQFYQDASLWWIIAAANNNITKGSLFPEPGTQLRIPTNINTVVELYNQYNTTR